MKALAVLLLLLSPLSYADIVVPKSTVTNYVIVSKNISGYLAGMADMMSYMEYVKGANSTSKCTVTSAVIDLCWCPII